VNEKPLPVERPEWQHAAIQLLQGPVFEHEGERWRRVTQGHSSLNSYFGQIGLRVMIDALEGYAYLEQMPVEETRNLPRLIKRHPLSKGATVYGFFLRHELDRALKEDPGSARVRRTLRQIRELVADFFPPSNDEAKDRRFASQSLFELMQLGFVRKAPESGEGSEISYELTRLLRAKFNPITAQDYLERIRAEMARKKN
jgi:hypothetical protein